MYHSHYVFLLFDSTNTCLIFSLNTLCFEVTSVEFHMANDTSSIMDSFSLNKEEESHCAGLSQSEVDGGLDSCRYGVFMVVYGGGTIHPLGFRSAM